MNQQINMVALKMGDQNEFRKLFDNYYHPLKYFSLTIIKDEMTAEDLVLDTFRKVYEKQSEFETETNIKAFLYITTKNACLNALKQRQVHSKSKNELAYLSDSPFEKTADQRMFESDLLNDLSRAIEQLPQKRKEIFKLKYNGMSIEEIATQLGIDKNTIYVHLSLGYKDLRELLNNPS